MKKRHHSSYEQARAMALRRDGTYCFKKPTSPWEVCFVNVGSGRAKEIAVHASGEHREGGTWVIGTEGGAPQLRGSKRSRRRKRRRR